jgi:hypothetical protein
VAASVLINHVGLQVPELNVQNGVLKSLSFLFEYIGEMGKDYIYAVTPLLEDALMDRDLVHRQTAASVVQHMALGVAGMLLIRDSSPAFPSHSSLLPSPRQRQPLQRTSLKNEVAKDGGWSTLTTLPKKVASGCSIP